MALVGSRRLLARAARQRRSFRTAAVSLASGDAARDVQAAAAGDADTSTGGGSSAAGGGR